jgi:diguanylate cyclase (GGDEF)-like protein
VLGFAKCFTNKVVIYIFLCYNKNMTPAEQEPVIGTLDSLTGLLNAHALREKLDFAAESGEDFAVVFVDNDGLKRVNDTVGHNAGDEVIVETASTLVNILRINEQEQEPRPTDLIGRDVFRNGGDEFVVMLGGVKDQETVDKIIARMRAALISKGINASMGGLPYNQGESTARLLHNADSLMYAEKHVKKEEKKHQAREKFRNEALAARFDKFFVMAAAEAINQLADKYSGLKRPK